jgi:hypothetical protein
VAIIAYAVIITFELLGMLVLFCAAALLVTWTWFRLAKWRDNGHVKEMRHP